MRVGLKMCIKKVVRISDGGKYIEILTIDGRSIIVNKEDKWGDILITQMGDLDESED